MLAREVKPFTLKQRIMYKMGKNNKMRRCWTTSKAQILLKVEGIARARRHFIANIIAKKYFDVGY
jgi:hypothetical protein